MSPATLTRAPRFRALWLAVLLVTALLPVAVPVRAAGGPLHSIHPPELPLLGNDLSFSDWTASNGMLFFLVKKSDGSRDLWRSAGTPASTILLKTFPPGFVILADPLDAGLLFFAPGADGSRDLWRSAGTPETTTLVRDLPADPQDTIEPVELLGARLVFQAPTDDGSVKLWRTDGTPGGTAPLPASTQRNLYTPLAFVGKTLLYFGGPSGDVELWKTDGTDAGSSRVKDINPSGSSLFDQVSIRGMFHSTGSKVFFGATDGVNGVELWQSDGTAAGTTMVKDLLPGTASSLQLGYVGALGDIVLFSSYAGRNLWRTDGTAAGTYELLADDFALNGTSAVVNGTLYFPAFTGNYQTELWRSDGTQAGTRLVKDLNPGTGTHGGSWPKNLTALGDRLFFTACDINGFSTPGGSFNGAGRGLYVTDGTDAGTRLLQLGALYDYCSGTITAGGGKIYYDDGEAVYAFDEESNGGLVLPQASPQRLSSTGEMIGGAYFQSVDPVTGSGTSTGHSLWRTDGTVANTSVFQADLRLSESIVVGDTVYMYGRHFDGSREFFATSMADLLAVQGNVTAAGGTVRALDGQTAISFPAGAVAGDVTVTFRPLAAPTAPTGELQAVRGFTLEARNAGGQLVTSFAKPLTLTVRYTDAEVAGMYEPGLSLAYWDGDSWASLLPCAGCSHDRATNTITVSLSHFTEFALLAEDASATYLPGVAR